MDIMLYIRDAVYPHWEIAVKLLAAFILGGIIGLERESKGKPVGFKTCVIIATASCMLTIVSITSAEHYAELASNIRTDPMRLAAQVISGVGFIGAGVILHRRDDAISGLTTAAIVWASAGIGIACGAGFYLYALLVTFLFLLSIKLSPVVSHLHFRYGAVGKIRVKIIILNKEGLNEVIAEMKKNKYLVDGLTIRDIKKDLIEINMKVSLRRKTSLSELYSTLKALASVRAVALEY
ncbi:MgtC/SapB family protein [Serratia marcescens]